MRRTLLLVVVLAAVTACEAFGGPGGGAAGIHGDWQLRSGTRDGQPIPLVEGHPITLTIDGATASGRAACNSYGGDIEIRGNSITLGEVASTLMACDPPAVMESEAAYLEALGSVDTARREGEGLILSGEGTELRFVRLPPVPAAELVDTVWVLDTLLIRDTAATTLGDRATLQLSSDGTLIGSTGCRSLRGRYVVSGGEILATELAAEGECPAEVAEQDSHVVTVLGDGFTAAVEGSVLTLMDPGGLGLGYHAETR